MEASRLVFAPQARRDALMQLLGYMAAMADFYEAEWLMACPRMEHSAMYQRLFGFRPMAEPRPYHGVKFETQLLAVRRSELKERCARGEADDEGVGPRADESDGVSAVPVRVRSATDCDGSF